MNNKKKWFTSLVVGLSLLLAGCASLPSSPATGDIPPLITEWTEKHVWKVVRGERSHGSAFWINSKEMVTACHVVDDLVIYNKGRGIVQTNDRSIVVTFKVTSCNKRTDIAILERTMFEGNFWVEPTPISYILPKKNSVVYGSGYPLWFPLTTNDGFFGEEITLEDGRLRYTNSVPTYMGDSGSPLLSIRNGKVFIEGVRVQIAGVWEMFAPVYVPHLALATSGKQILTELVSNNARKQSRDQ